MRAKKKELSEGIFKMINDEMVRLNQEQFIVLESWRRTKKRLQMEYPTATIKYSYKTRQFKIIFPLPSELISVKSVQTKDQNQV